jgi:hypothetical protein
MVRSYCRSRAALWGLGHYNPYRSQRSSHSERYGLWSRRTWASEKNSRQPPTCGGRSDWRPRQHLPATVHTRLASRRCGSFSGATRGDRQKRLSEKRLGDGWTLRRPSPSGRRTSRALCPSAACRARAGGGRGGSSATSDVRPILQLQALQLAVRHAPRAMQLRSDFDQSFDRTSIGLRETIEWCRFGGERAVFYY